jgi:hypothetical protein
MSATIHYMRDHYRVRPDVVHGRSAPPRLRPQWRPRSDLGLILGILVFILALVLVGVWLTDGVASVGRSNNQCLTSARRVCGVFPSEHAARGGTRFQVGLSSPAVTGA